MKTILILALLISTSFGNDSRRGGIPSATPGDDLFFQGTYLEWSLNPASVFGNRDQVSGQTYGGSHVPEGYHNQVNGRLGVVVDYGLDGFDVGTPPHSGDAFAQGYNDIGFHVSFNGENGLEAWNNMPLLNDDDDADTSTTPYRGCITCSKGVRADSCESFDEDCSCNLDIEAASYTCPFKRWDLLTSSFNNTSNSTTWSVVWTGVAQGVTFENSNSGVLKTTGEQITITKTVYAGYNDTIIFESVQIENTGTVDLVNITLFWTIVPTLEAFQHDGFGSNSSTDFNNYFSIPYQPSSSSTIYNAKALAYSRGPWYNMTLALGAADPNARAWYASAEDWRSGVISRPYTGEVAFTADLPQSDSEVYAEKVMGLAIGIDALAVAENSTKTMFWAFHASQIEWAFRLLTPIMPLTTSPITTQPLTTQDMTTQPLTTQEMTTQQLTTQEMTTQQLTTQEMTTQQLTTQELTTQQLTTQELTTSPVTTSPVTTQHMTTSPVTTSPVTTHKVTTSPATTSPATTSPITTDSVENHLTGVSGDNLVGGNEAEADDRNIKIIASVFGVAGFILIALAVGGVILAVKRLKSNPVA